MAVKPVAKLIVDNPDADGRIELHGIGHRWRFATQQQAGPAFATAFDDPTRWALSDCEIIQPLGCLSVLGHASKGHMGLGSGAGEWQVVDGSQKPPQEESDITANFWREELLGGKPSVRWLSYIDSRADQWGQIRSVDNLDRMGLMVWVKRLAPPPDQTNPAWLEIEWLGDPSPPNEQVTYGWTFPIMSGDEDPGKQRYKQPLLWRRYGGDDPPVYAVIDQWERADAIAGEDGAMSQWFWIEQIDGVLVLASSSTADYWVYDAAAASYLAQPGQVRITLRGFAGAVNAQGIQLALEGTALARTSLVVPDWMNRDVPPSHIVIEGEYSDGGIVGTSIPGATAGHYQPKLTLTRVAGEGRPLCYAVDQYIAPAFSAARSDPYETQGRTELIELSWTRRWPARDWWFAARLRDPENYWLEKCREQYKVTVMAGFDTSAATQIMVAYLEDPAKELRAGEIEEELVITGHDYIAARLADKKAVAWSAGPEGWNLKDWVEWRLKCGGIPPALISVAATAYVVPKTRRKGEYEFPHEARFLDSLDEVLRAAKWMPLGNDTDGVLWTAPTADTEYAGGADYTLDESTQSKDDYIEWLSATTDSAEFANCVAVFADSQRLEGGVALDEASFKTPAAENFVGVDLWDIRVEEGVAAPSDAAAFEARAEEVLAQRLRRFRRLEWRTIGKPELCAGMFVRVKVAGVRIPDDDAVFRIVEDHATMRPDELKFSRTFICEHIGPYVEL